MHIMNFQIKLQKLPIAFTSLLREVSDRLFCHSGALLQV